VDDSGRWLAENLRQLRAARRLSQARAAQLADIPRATWATLESGASNPTLAVMSRAAVALQVSIEELIAPPRRDVRFFPAAEAVESRRQGAVIRPLLPENIPGIEISRIELQPDGVMVGVPHTPGTREYLTCESGKLELLASGRRWTLTPGDALVFRGDQRHSYRNLLPTGLSCAMSVVCFGGSS
jgi:transcriptional regulator with XRE-family HTH domain